MWRSQLPGQQRVAVGAADQCHDVRGPGLSLTESLGGEPASDTDSVSLARTLSGRILASSPASSLRGSVRRAAGPIRNALRDEGALQLARASSANTAAGRGDPSGNAFVDAVRRHGLRTEDQDLTQERLLDVPAVELLAFVARADAGAYDDHSEQTEPWDRAQFEDVSAMRNFTYSLERSRPLPGADGRDSAASGEEITWTVAEALSMHADVIEDISSNSNRDLIRSLQQACAVLKPCTVCIPTNELSDTQLEGCAENPLADVLRTTSAVLGERTASELDWNSASAPSRVPCIAFPCFANYAPRSFGSLQKFRKLPTWRRDPAKSNTPPHRL